MIFTIVKICNNLSQHGKLRNLEILYIYKSIKNTWRLGTKNGIPNVITRKNEASTQGQQTDLEASAGV